MFEIKIDNNFDKAILSIPTSLTLKPQVLVDISEIIRKDIETNLMGGTGLDGAGLPPKKKGGRLFYNTGELVTGVMKNTSIKPATIFIKPSRSVIAGYINAGTKWMPARPFWGISQRALLQVNDYLKKPFNEIFEKVK